VRTFEREGKLNMANGLHRALEGAQAASNLGWLRTFGGRRLSNLGCLEFDEVFVNYKTLAAHAACASSFF